MTRVGLPQDGRLENNCAYVFAVATCTPLRMKYNISSNTTSIRKLFLFALVLKRDSVDNSFCHLVHSGVMAAAVR